MALGRIQARADHEQEYRTDHRSDVEPAGQGHGQDERAARSMATARLSERVAAPWPAV